MLASARLVIYPYRKETSTITFSGYSMAVVVIYPIFIDVVEIK